MSPDESMQPWLGRKWREDSLYSQGEWITTMSEEKKVNVWVMTSWTKVINENVQHVVNPP